MMTNIKIKFMTKIKKIDKIYETECECHENEQWKKWYKLNHIVNIAHGLV